MSDVGGSVGCGRNEIPPGAFEIVFGVGRYDGGGVLSSSDVGEYVDAGIAPICFEKPLLLFGFTSSV